MRSLRKLLSRFAVIRELAEFLWEEKLWWMVPMIIVLLGLGFLIIFAQSSTVAPFIYVLF